MLNAEVLDRRRARDQRGFILLIAICAALPLVALVPLFGAPPDRDQGVYSVIGNGWLNGAVPYRDLWDNKGPLLFLWYAGAFEFLGDGLNAPRLLAAIVATATVPCIWATAAELLGPRRALFAAAIFGLSFFNAFLRINANAEVFMLLPLSMGLYCFVRGLRGSVLWFGLAGAFTMAAVLTKQPAVWSFAAYAPLIAFQAVRRREQLRRSVAGLALLGLGASLAVLPFVAYFASKHALHEFWYATVEFNLLFGREFPFLLKLVPPLLWNPLPLVGGLAFWLLAAIGVVRLWRERSQASVVILSVLAVSELGAQSVGKNSAHYNVQLLPAAALAGAVGFDVLRKHWRQGSKLLPRLFVGAAAITVAAALFVYAWPDADQRFLAQHAFHDYAQDSVQAEDIARTVQLVTEPGDTIYDFGRHSEIYTLAERSPASRWIHNRPFEVDPDVLPEIVADLERSRAAVVLITYECRRFAREFENCEDGLPPLLESYLAQKYVRFGKVEYAEVYLRRGEPSAVVGDPPI